MDKSVSVAGLLDVPAGESTTDCGRSHIHIIIHYYYCGWVMCTLVQYTGRQSQNIEVFHHIHTTYCTLVMSGLIELKKKIKKGHPLGVEQTHGWLYRDFPHILCTWSFRECRRHYSSWEVSRESQSSPLRFFVESIATDHQEASSFFFMEKIRPLEDSNPRPGA